MIASDGGVAPGMGDELRRRAVELLGLVVGQAWRRVFTLSAALLGGGVALVALADGGILSEIGAALIGGSVVGLVFAIVQHTLDLLSAERQTALQRSIDARMLVSSTPNLDGVDLAGIDLREAYLRRKRLVSASLERAQLSEADLRESDLSDACLRHADLRAAELEDAVLSRALLDEADLRGARLRGARLDHASLVAAQLSQADLSAVETSTHVDLSRAVLDDARLSSAGLVAVRASFLSARRVDAGGAVLRDGDLSCADLQGAGLRAADLRGADLTGADLRDSVLALADLRGARLVGARLDGADLTGARLDGADLRAADLRGAHLTNAALDGAALEGAWVRSTDRDHRGAGHPAATGVRVVDAVAPPAGRDDRLVVVAGEGIDRGRARAVAARLRARRAALDRIHDSVEEPLLARTSPHLGSADELGLPRRVTVRRRPPRRGRWVELRWAPGAAAGAGTTVAALCVPGRRPPGVSVVSRVAVPDAAGGPDHLATAVQHLLAGPRAFATVGELEVLASWLDEPARIRDDLPGVLDRNRRNPVALLLRAWDREWSDLRQVQVACDELRIAWAAHESPLGRALAASRLGWARSQLLHRSTPDVERTRAQARAAGEVAVGLYAGVVPARRPPRRLLALQLQAQMALGFAHAVTEDKDPESLTTGIAALRSAVELAERHALPARPTAHNTLGYFLMAAAGRHVTGPGARYADAERELRQVLSHYDVTDDDDPGDDGGRYRVAELAGRAHQGRSAADDPAAARLRERPLRLALANLGNIHRLRKEFDRALACYGAAIYCDPDYLEAHAERAWVHLERGDRAEAEADIRCVIEHARVGTPAQKARLVVGYARALERVGLADQQRRWIDTALGLDPGNAEAVEMSQR